MPKLRLRGIDFYYEATGRGPAVLFIHGLGSSTRDWQPQVDALSGSFKTITFDVRGHGQSDKPPGPYGIPLFAADTAALIDGLGIAPTHVVGLSMGGMIALELALNWPALVSSLVIVNAGPQLLLRTWKERLGALERLLIVRFRGMRKMGEVLGSRLFPKKEQQSLRRQFVSRWAQNDRRAYEAAMRSLVGWSVADRVGEIGCRTLVIAADHDYTPLATKRAYVAEMPKANLLVIEDSRHFTPIERPEPFNEALLTFLSE